MDQQFLALYHRHVGMAYDRQLRFAEYLERNVPGQDWTLDTENAILAFGPKLKFEASLLGSHAHHNHSWLWAWSNKQIKLSFTNRALGETLRAVAHRLGLHDLTHPGFPLEPLLGEELTESAVHVLGVVLGAELGFDAYFVAPYDGGDALALVRDERFNMKDKHPLRRVLTVFPQAIAGMPDFDHPAALRAYADDHGIAVAREGNTLKLTFGKDHLIATFDSHDRLTSLEGTVQPESPPKTIAKKARTKTSAQSLKKKSAKKPAVKKSTKPTAKVAAKTTKKPVKPAVKKTSVKLSTTRNTKPAAKSTLKKAGSKKK